MNTVAGSYFEKPSGLNILHDDSKAFLRARKGATESSLRHACPPCTVEGLLTHNPTIKGLNPATGKEKEKEGN
jgi:hypothetical protein